nr:F0F1 ATP synthase subunit gamma [Armatimonadota bacterium]
MPSIRELRSRIKSVQNIQKITRAMKLVAAARQKKAQD